MNGLNKLQVVAIMAAIGFAIAGCDSVVKPKGTLNPNFGNAVRHNMAVQIVNPDASAGITEAPDLDGKRANTAVADYEKGATKQVEKIITSNVGN